MDELSEGLSETAKHMLTKRENSNKKYSVLQELFAHARVLTESAHSTTEDFLNEATFRYALLETYRILGAAPESNTDVILELRKQRNNVK